VERNIEALPLLSIVIPTRNRKRYAISAIKSILSIHSNELELVVQDNSDSDDLPHYLGEHASDPRLHYTYTSSRLSIVDNFNQALKKTRGEYVCCIGDDDVVNFEIVSICRWAKGNTIDAITDNWRVTFNWPDFIPNNATAKAGILSIRKFSGKAKLLDPEVELKKCILSGGVGLQRLPKVYLGIVRRACLSETLQRIMRHQAGTCADMYLSVAIASSVKRLCVLDYPVVIPGFSAAGAGMLISTRRHQGRIEDSPHLRACPNYEWPDIIPRFYSVETFYAESAWAALQATGRVDLIRKFNLAFLYLLCATLYPEYRAAVQTSLRLAKQAANQNYAHFVAQHVWRLFEEFGALVGKRIEARSLYLWQSALEKQIGGIDDTQQAAKALREYLIQKCRQFDADQIHIVNK
jgi:hypothetical protein